MSIRSARHGRKKRISKGKPIKRVISHVRSNNINTKDVMTFNLPNTINNILSLYDDENNKQYGLFGYYNPYERDSLTRAQLNYELQGVYTSGVDKRFRYIAKRLVTKSEKEQFDNLTLKYSAGMKQLDIDIRKKMKNDVPISEIKQTIDEYLDNMNNEFDEMLSNYYIQLGTVKHAMENPRLYKYYKKPQDIEGVLLLYKTDGDWQWITHINNLTPKQKLKVKLVPYK